MLLPPAQPSTSSASASPLPSPPLPQYFPPFPPKHPDFSKNNNPPNPSEIPQNQAIPRFIEVLAAPVSHQPTHRRRPNLQPLAPCSLGPMEALAVGGHRVASQGHHHPTVTHVRWLHGGSLGRAMPLTLPLQMIVDILHLHLQQMVHQCLHRRRGSTVVFAAD